MDLHFEEFFNYLPVTTIFNLVFFSRFVRRKLLPKLNFTFKLAKGFGSQKRWKNFLIDRLKSFFTHLHSARVTHKWPLDFIFPGIFKTLRRDVYHHLNLPSILFHLLRCSRTCDTAPTSCHQCSRLGMAQDKRWLSFEDSFDNIKIKKSNCNFFHEEMILDLDVFTSKANDYFKYFKIGSKYRYYYQEVRYCDDLLAIFCSHLIRIFLSVTTSSVIEMFLLESDKNELLEIFVVESIQFLSQFLHHFNIDYFYEFFDKLKEYNSCLCFDTRDDKLKHGPYIHSVFDVTLQTVYL